MAPDAKSGLLQPVQVIETGSAHDDPSTPEHGVALCLSGGGYRAMLFHLGALWRRNEMAVLPKLARISSVSGGSITAGVLGFKWGQLSFDPTGVATRFAVEVVEPTTSTVTPDLGGRIIVGRSAGAAVHATSHGTMT